MKKKSAKSNNITVNRIMFGVVLLVASLFVISFIYRNKPDQKIIADDRKENNEHHDSHDKEHKDRCPADHKHNPWKVCYYGTSSYDKHECRELIKEFKKAIAPLTDDDDSWYDWARKSPKPLECGIACEVAPSLCSGSPTPTVSKAPKATNTPKVTQTVTPSQNPSPTVSQGPASGPYLLFDPTDKELQAGDQFNVDVMVDTLDQQTLSTDAYIVYDSTMVQPVSTSQGDFYPTINASVLASSVVMRGIVTEPADYRTGSGLMGTITFKALKNGVATVTYYCDDAAGDTSKIVQNNIDASNIINCADNRTLTINIGGVTTTVSPNPISTTISPSSTHASPTNTPHGKLSKTAILLIILIFIIMIMIMGI